MLEGGVPRVHEEPQDAARLVTATQDELVRFIEDDRLIRFDSFIAPAVIRKMVDSIHLYCLQDDGTDAGVDATLLQENNCSQTIYSSYGDLAKRMIPNPVVLDLCLDLFNRSDMYDQGDLWSAEDIDAFLSEFRRQIQAADLITISLSFGYSGTEGDTRALARHVVPQILAQRNET